MTPGTWRELVSVAVVGTERRGVPPVVATDVAELVEEPLPAGPSEEHVLLAAGVLGAWRRAGVAAPQGDGPLPDPAPDDERPAASTRAVHLLELLLDGHAGAGGATTDLVAEWLTRCARSGRRPPAGILPRIMDAATTATALRAPARAAGGPTARWLGARNPAWAWAQTTDTAPERVWAEGAPPERRAVLAALRADDPPRARALLEGTWPTESAADRARFVETLATGLSPDDEPFLEAALDDRSKTVRAAAAELLAALPTSALARRMTGRLRPRMTVHRHDGAAQRLAVEPPDEIDAAAARDGVVARGGPGGTGRRAWTLRQIVGAAPLGFWERELGAGPAEVVRLGAGSADLLAGWSLAAARQRDTAWARELLRHRPDPALLAALPPPAAHEELAPALSRVADDAVGPLLAATPAPWPAEVSRAVVGRLRSAEHRQTLLSVVPTLATALDPAVAAEIEAWAGSLRADHPVRARLRSVMQTLSLRHAIAAELADRRRMDA